MTRLDELLPQVDQLRAERNGLGQQLYALRGDILRTRNVLSASRQLGARRGPPDPGAVAALRAQIAQIEQRLQELAQAERSARSRIAEFEDARRRIQFLERSLAGLRTSWAQLRAMRKRVAASKPINRKKVVELKAAGKTARRGVVDTKWSLRAETAALARLEQQAGQARSQVRSLAAESARLRQSIDAKQDEIGALRGATGPSSDRLRQQLAALNERYASTKAAWKAGRTKLQETIAGIYVDPHPRAAVGQMSDTTPFVLLPVRIETRFIIDEQRAEGAVRELWLRVYPDDIAVHTHEAELTEREVIAGEAYWRSLFDIEKGTASDKAAQKTETWKRFAVLFGPSRSAWVARQTRPSNWDVVTTLAAADALVFSVQASTRPSAWSRAPRTHVLPDRFVALLYVGDSVVHEVVGNAVPDELILGPDPLDLVAEADEADVEDSFVTVDGQLTFGSTFDWASKFDKAVALGMGFRIPITPVQARGGFDRIVVLGVMASAGPQAGGQLLAQLLANHHLSPKGLSLVRQGTATNNMDDNQSGYSINDTLAQTGEVTGLDVPLFNEHSDCDGRRLADALGIGHETLHFVFNSDNHDYRDAVAMNHALYPGTLGYYFDTLLNPVLPQPARDRLREFFVQQVTGRGPLAPIRIGDQPYGLLLTSDFTAWQEGGRKRDRFLDVLVAVLRHFDAVWQGLLPLLVHAGKPGVSSETAVINVLGLQPGSVTFAQRVGYSYDYLRNLAKFQYGGSEFDEVIGSVLKRIRVTTLLRGFGARTEDTTGDAEDRLPLLKLIYQHYTTSLDAANLVDRVPLSETDTVREYDPVAHKNYLHWLHDTTTVNALAAQNFGGATAPSALLYLQLRHALLLQLHRTAVDWMKRFNIDGSKTATARTFNNIRPGGDLTRWEALRAPVSRIDASHPDRTVAVADYLLSPVDLEEKAFLSRMREALATLAGLSTARLERCFTEHLDTCTYRLDAWQTALFKTRLDALRGNGTAIETVAPGGGAYVGAFGWVVDIRPATSWKVASDVPEKLLSPKGAALREYAANGGLIHGPSINHVTAAALLRSGYMSHATPAQPDAMAVNLSSERVRRALFVLQGMRNGQSIEALLGYQFERAIHDRGSADASLSILNGFIFDIRVAFPIKRVRLAAGPSGGAEETTDSYEVVNGLTLAQTPSPDWAAITGADATVLTPARIAALNRERDAVADSLDAVKDLLLSESAYQLVQGNFDRAGATLASIKEARVPPDLDIIKTPRSSRFTFTQRIVISFARLDPLDPASVGWDAMPMTPRAALEPGVNQWLARVLGAPEDIIYTAMQVLEDGTLVAPAVMSVAHLELQPIDLVHILGADLSTGRNGRSGASEIEARIAWRYRNNHGLDETATVQIQFAAPKNQPGLATMAEVMPLMRALQSVLSQSPALDARHFHTSTPLGGSPGSGADYTDLRTRTQRLQQQVDDVLVVIRALSFSALIGSVSVSSLGQGFDEIRAQEADLAQLSFNFATGDMLVLQQALFSLSCLGVPDALPRVQNIVTDAAKVALLVQALEITAAAAARHASSVSLLADADAAVAALPDRAVALAVDASKAIVGQAFVILPVFALANEADVLQSAGDRTELMTHASATLQMTAPEDEWLRSVAHVRPKAATWDRIRLLHESLFGTTLDLHAIQLPYRSRDRWLSVPFPATDPAVPEQSFDIVRDTLSMVNHGAAAFAPGTLRCGLLVDAWTETIPAVEQSTGVAFHYNRPDAMPPQAVLVAVPPVVTGHWSWDGLVAILLDTLRRAKLRAVEPRLLDEWSANEELGVLLPALVSEFQQYDLNVSLDLRLNLIALMPALQSFYLNPNLDT